MKIPNISNVIGKGKKDQKVAEPIKIVANVASAASAAAKLAKVWTDAEVQSMIEENKNLKLQNQLLIYEKQGLASGYEKEKKALIDQNEKEKKALIDQNAKLKSEIKSLRDYQGDALAGTLLDFKERKEIQVMIQQMSQQLDTAIAANQKFAEINQQLVKENTELKAKLAQKESSSKSSGSNSNSSVSSSNTSPVNQISNDDVKAPPPPPPMPPDWKAGAANSKTPPAQGGKIPASNPAALLQAIHDGTPLRKVDAQAPAKEGKTPDRQELLEAIQRGVKLKKVELAEKPKAKDSTNDLQAVLQKGLAKINAVMGYSTSTADDDWNDTEEEASTTSSVAQETSKITKTPEASAPAINANASTDKKPEATIPAIKAFTDKKLLENQSSRGAMRIESPQLKIQNSQVNLAAKKIVERNGANEKLAQNVSIKAALPSNTPPASNASEKKESSKVTELAKKFGVVRAISPQKRY